MSDKIEDVARALAADVSVDFDALAEEDYAAGKPHWRGQARAAIAAMREPTAEMISAGSPRCFVNRSNYGGPQSKEVWQAMIDSALSDKGDAA